MYTIDVLFLLVPLPLEYVYLITQVKARKGVAIPRRLLRNLFTTGKYLVRTVKLTRTLSNRTP